MEIAAGALGSLAGGELGNATTKGSSNPNQVLSPYYETPSFVNTMDNTLMTGLQNALSVYNQGTTQAINQQNTSLNAANNALTTGVNTANQQATNTLNGGLSQFQALNAPAAAVSYGALDNYADTLGLSRPKMGSQALAQALYANANAQNSLNSLGSAVTNPGLFTQQAPGLLQSYINAVTPEQQQQYINQSFANQNIPAQFNIGAGNPNNPFTSQIMAIDGPNAANALGNQAYTNATNQYNTALGSYNNSANLYNNYQTAAGQAVSGITPQQAAIASAAQQGLFTKGP